MMAAGKKEEEEEGGYKMDIKLLKKDDEKGKLSFMITGTSPWFVNTLRRTMIEEVPTLAIEDIEFRDNSSALYDEIIAHRLGLIPIKTDLKSYSLPTKKEAESGEYSAMSSLKMTLKAKGAGVVYANEIKSKDPKCIPVFPKMPIVKLLKGQSIEAEMTAVMGKGRIHTKWSPCLAYYRGYPIFELQKRRDANVNEAISKCNGLLKQTSKGLEITDINKWNEAYENICEENGINVSISDTDIIFYIESWGQISARDIVKEAVSVFQKKLDEFKKLLK